MRRLIILLTILQIIHGACPDGFELVRDGECRGSNTKTRIAWINATDQITAVCMDVQGQPIIIHNEEHQTYWTGRVSGYTPIGLMCNNNTKLWEWADGSPVDYKPASYNNGLDYNCFDTGWSLNYQGNDGHWNPISGGSIYDIYCTTQLQQPTPSADGCANFEDDSEDGICYQIVATSETWQDAQMDCQKIGADLASIHNTQENSFVRRLAVSKGAVNGVFLGGTLSGKGNNFGWIDGTAWDYDNFFPGFPISGLGNCIAMDTSTSTGQWMNVDCSAKIPVACIRKQKPVVEPTCSSETWKEGAIITSPGFPYSASTPCDYFFTVEAGKKVELEIVLLEANTCCDSLIVYDGYFGGIVLANLTGEMRNATYTTSSSNTMRVSWQPNGGVNVRGMAITFRGV